MAARKLLLLEDDDGELLLLLETDELDDDDGELEQLLLLLLADDDELSELPDEADEQLELDVLEWLLLDALLQLEEDSDVSSIDHSSATH